MQTTVRLIGYLHLSFPSGCMLSENRFSLRIGNTLPSRGWHPVRLDSNKKRGVSLVGHLSYIILEMVK